MEQEVLAVSAEANARPGRVEGRVRIALIDDFAAHWFVPRLPILAARHPALHVIVLTGREHMDLSRGEADIAVRLPRPVRRELTAIKIGTPSIALFAERAAAQQNQWKLGGARTAKGIPFLLFTSELQ